jgi:excisionase family DNA binding protein
MDKFRSVTERIAWSVNEVSGRTGLSQGFLRKEIKSRKLRAKRAGRRVLVLDRDLRRYLGDDRGDK